MIFQSDEQRTQALSKLSLMALYILMATNLTIVIVGYFVDKGMSRADVIENVLARNALFLIAAGEFAAMYFVKRSMLRKIPPADHEMTPEARNVWRSYLASITIVIAAMSSAISIYGLVALFLGSKFEVLILFVAISLVGYQFFRLRPKDFENR